MKFDVTKDWLKLIGMAREEDGELIGSMVNGLEGEKEKLCSLNLTCNDMYTLPDLDKHLNPLCIGLGPRKTHFSECC